MVLHFFLLASFFWMSAIAVNVFWGFYNLWRNGVPPPPTFPGGMRPIHYRVIACCWGLPLAATSFCVLLDLVLKPDCIGYGIGESCWIGEEFSRLITFAIPAFVSLFFNLLSAVASLVIMYHLRQQAASLNFHYPHHREMALVAVRLFVSIGSQWFFGFLLYIIEENMIIEYLFVCTTSLQGTFCFFCIVTRRLWRRKLTIWARDHIRCGANRVHASTNASDLHVQGGDDAEGAVRKGRPIEGEERNHEVSDSVHERKASSMSDCQSAARTGKRDLTSASEILTAQKIQKMQKSVVKKNFGEQRLRTLVENDEN